MTGRVSHKKNDSILPKKTKKSQAVARRHNKVIFILTCSLFEKCTRMAQRQYLVEKGSQVVSVIWLFCF